MARARLAGRDSPVGVKTDTLNPLEGLTDREFAAHADYVTVMDQNLAKIRKALACS